MTKALYSDSVEPEYYSGSSVFVNKQNIKDPEKLKSIEADVSLLRSLELLQNPEIIEKTFDFNHLKSIHQFIFQDLYTWAGKPRSFDMLKNGDIFTLAKELAYYEKEVFKESIAFSLLKAQPTHFEAVKSLSTTIRKINAFHPFPEGNGRTQRVFISTLAKEHGYAVDWKSVQTWEAPEIFHQAHIGNTEPLELMFDKILIIRA